jgi:Gly-Xaa carboxypeptidase
MAERKVLHPMLSLTTVNALPESAHAVVNHRIAMESSVKAIEDHLIDLIMPLSQSIKATFIAFDKEIYTPPEPENPWNTTIILATEKEPLEPAPVSPLNSSAWSVLSRTVKAVFGQETILAPSLMTGNTDTKHYWDLTRDIWRFTPIRSGGRGNAHTVDEFVGQRDHVDGFGFYVKLILYANGDT